MSKMNLMSVIYFAVNNSGPGGFWLGLLEAVGTEKGKGIYATGKDLTLLGGGP